MDSAYYPDYIMVYQDIEQASEDSTLGTYNNLYCSEHSGVRRPEGTHLVPISGPSKTPARQGALRYF